MTSARAIRGCCAFWVASLSVFAAIAPSAGAHARVVSGDPADGSALPRAPTTVRLRFNEQVSPSFLRAVLLDERGRAVAGIRVSRAGDGRQLVIWVPLLPRGTYQVDWEVLAQADGHVSSGAMAFGVRARPVLGARTRAGDAPPPAEAVLRWIDFALLAGLLGGLVISLLLERAARDVPAKVVRDARRRVLAGAGWSGGLALAFGAALLIRQAHALLATLPDGASLWDATDRLFGVRWGALWVAREALLVALTATALLLRAAPRASQAARAAPAAVAALALALVTVRAVGSHAATVRPSGPAVVADAVHLLAAAVWMGGVPALAIALKPGRGAAELARACGGPFALTATVSVVALAATGLYAAGAQITSVDGLLTTFYGQTLIAKTALVILAGALGLTSSVLLRTMARGGNGHRQALSRLLIAEMAAGLYILLAAGVLTASSPPRGPEFAPPRPARAPTLVAQVGDVLVTSTARPNRPGNNIFSVLAVSSRRPPPEPIERVTLRIQPADGGEGQVSVALSEGAPGRYSGGARLPEGGRWRMTVNLLRGGRRLSTGFTWAVDPEDVARPVAVSAQPLAPLLARTVGVVALLALTVAASAAWRRRTRPRTSRPVALIEPLGKEAS
jgi:copper transport protein